MDLGSKYQRKLAVGLVLVSPLLVSPSLSAAQLERLEPNHGRVVSLEKQNLAATQNVAKALGLKPGNNVQKLKANQDKMVMSTSGINKPTKEFRSGGNRSFYTAINKGKSNALAVR